MSNLETIVFKTVLLTKYLDIFSLLYTSFIEANSTRWLPLRTTMSRAMESLNSS